MHRQALLTEFTDWRLSTMELQYYGNQPNLQAEKQVNDALNNHVLF
ncbi:hypothetical protein [Spirosoma aerolatum]|nr:hypothetical protein [Spirosoma aerolatum]